MTLAKAQRLIQSFNEKCQTHELEDKIAIMNNKLSHVLPASSFPVGTEGENRRNFIL